MSASDRNLIFISHSRKDRNWLPLLRKHFRPLVRDSALSVWADRQARAGESWRTEVDEALARCRIAILMVSENFLVSDLVSEFELPYLLDAASQGRLKILWIPVGPSAWEKTPIAQYPSIWHPAQPLSTLSLTELEKAFVDISRNLARAIKEEEASEALKQTPTFRIRKIHLENIRCFDDVTLDLSLPSGPSLRTVITGDNATGKTTLLRAIALGLCDESDATALLKQVPGRFARGDGSEPGVIEIELMRNGSGEPCSIRTEIQRTGTSSERVRKELVGLSSTEEVFVVGFGTQRTKPGIRSHERYTAAAAIATLFDLDETLQNPELIMGRQPVWLRGELKRKILGILLLDDERIEDSGGGLTVTGPWGRQLFEVLSDGYRSTAQWILDFASWAVFAGRTSDLEGLSGIVLIDELEQHLHPQWQRQIVARLGEHLPGVQFIVSSHSPLIARSIGSVDPEQTREKLIHLTLGENGRVDLQESPPLKGLTTDQVLASPAFDYLIEADPEVEQILAEASRLASKGSRRNPKEEERYLEIKALMVELISPEGDTEIERDARQELHKRMKARIRELEAAVFGGAR